MQENQQFSNRDSKELPDSVISQPDKHCNPDRLSFKPKFFAYRTTTPSNKNSLNKLILSKDKEVEFLKQFKEEK